MSVEKTRSPNMIPPPLGGSSKGTLTRVCESPSGARRPGGGLRIQARAENPSPSPCPLPKREGKIEWGFIASLAIIFTSPALAQRELKDLPDPDPKAELASFKVADGFEVNLFAAEPMVTNPTHMNWDARGRLWVATTPIYPHIKPGQKPQDKIIVLEDTDGDGKADKSTVFADGLLIPTAVLPDASGTGAYVANSTEILYMRDTDGDGKADKTTILLDGFGTEDTHHILHTFRFGPDGAMYFNQSIYIHSSVETPWGVKRLDGSGIWRFRPESMKLEVVMRGLVNPWGHAFTDFGQSFATDGAGGEGINFAFPGSAFVSAVGAPRIMRGLNPGQPKHCGLEIVTGRHFPDDWQGTLVTNDFRGNRINRFALSDDGSGFVSRQLPDLLTSSHMAFRPVDVKMGPDGALYVCDWYNPIIQHGEVDFRDPRRDHDHGRIWRITAKGRPLVAKPQAAEASVAELLEMLKLPEQYTRQHAKMQLQARGAEAVKPELDKWVAGLDATDKHFEQIRLEGLWTYQSIGVIEPKLLQAVLESPDFNTRAAAVRVLAEWHAQIPDAMAMLEKAVADDHPRVRLEAVSTLRAVGTPRAAELALTALNKDVDGNLDYALWLTTRELAPKWLPEFQAGKLRFGNNSSQIAFALRAIENPAALGPLIKMLESGQVAEADRPGTIALIGDLGDANALGVLFNLATNPETKNRSLHLEALVKAARQRKIQPPGTPNELGMRLMEPLGCTTDERLRAAAARLFGLWKANALGLEELATHEKTSDNLRDALMEGFAAYGGNAALDELLPFTLPDRPVKLRASAVAALVSVDPNVAAGLAAEVLPTTSESQALPIFDAFLRKQQGPDILAKALEDKKLPDTVAAAGIRRASSSGAKVDALNAALTKAGGLEAMTQQLTPEQMAKLVAEVAAKGDGHRGESVFRRVTLQCTVCHAIAGGGGKVGPDLVSLGASAPVDYIVESLLEPSKKIKEGYHMTVVTTKDGKVVSGGLMKETDRELVLRDAADQQITIPVADVQQKIVVPASLMPPGLTATLRRDEFLDLVKFMSLLGKDGDFKAPAGRWVRAWSSLQGSPQIGAETYRRSLGFVATDDPMLAWLPAYSTVAGELPLDSMSPFPRGDTRFAAVRFSVDVTTAGVVGFKFSDTTGLQLWHNGSPVTVQPVTGIDLPRGRQTLTLAVNLNQRTTPLKIEVVDVENSAGRAQPGP